MAGDHYPRLMFRGRLHKILHVLEICQNDWANAPQGRDRRLRGSQAPGYHRASAGLLRCPLRGWSSCLSRHAGIRFWPSCRYRYGHRSANQTASRDDAYRRSIPCSFLAATWRLSLGTAASLRACLAKYVDRPRRLGSICTGALILAELGVLNGREATTHWSACGRLERDYPKFSSSPTQSMSHRAISGHQQGFLPGST